MEEGKIGVKRSLNARVPNGNFHFNDVVLT